MCVHVGPQAIPLPRLKVVLPLVFGRTQDKSSNVRKNAIQFMTGILASNPFAAKVNCVCVFVCVCVCVFVCVCECVCVCE